MPAFFFVVIGWLHNLAGRERNLSEIHVKNSTGLRIKYDEFVEKYGAGTISEIIPDAQSDGLVTYSYPRSVQKLFLTFNFRTRELLSATL